MAVPIVGTLALQIIQSRNRRVEAPTADKAKVTPAASKAKAAPAAGKAKATTGTGKGAPSASKEAPKRRRSTRYYAVTALIAGLENPTSRKVIIGGLKLLRNFV